MWDTPRDISTNKTDKDRKVCPKARKALGLSRYTNWGIEWNPANREEDCLVGKSLARIVDGKFEIHDGLVKNKADCSESVARHSSTLADALV